MRLKVLVSSSRMPFAVQEIRKLGETGHEVYAADTFATAPGNHSRFVCKALITPAPIDDALAYVEAVAGLVREHRIDRLLPTFEEVFYLARHRELLADRVELFFAEFETLARLHDKVAFTKLCAELGIAVAPWIVARSRDELGHAIREFDEGFFARPAFSRGGLDLFTNRGPLAGELSLDDCSPTPANPWLVQPFLRGEDRCSFAIARRGRLAAHVCYVHPRTIEHAGGIVFESIRDPEMVDASARIIEATGYQGQLAVDFIRTDEGLIAIECNPRATAGVSLMSAAEFTRAVTDEVGPAPILVPSGRRRKISAAIVREMLRDPRGIPGAIRALRDGGQDLYARLDDPLPALFQVLSYVHVLRYLAKRSGRSKRSSLMAAYLHDLRWDGEPIG